MKKIVLYVLFVVIILVCSILIVKNRFTGDNLKYENSIDNTNIQEPDENTLTEIVTSKAEIVETAKDNEIADKTKDNIKEEKNNKNKENIIVKNSKNETKTENINKDNTKEEKTERVKEKTEVKPWDEYGITEYDYYHKPMWSWARVDYSLDKYGSENATHQACIDDGNKLEDIISFSCTPLNNYAGEYIGDMLRIKK